MAIGHKIWAIPEGYIPGKGVSNDRALMSHETACILNTTERDADVTITLYFANREPVGPYRIKVHARRTLHLRFNDLRDPEPVPRDVDYASVIESTEPLLFSIRAWTRAIRRLPCCRASLLQTVRMDHGHDVA